MVKKIFLVYGHYNDNSFNAAIRDTFVKTTEAKGSKVDLVDFIKKNLILFLLEKILVKMF